MNQLVWDYNRIVSEALLFQFRVVQHLIALGQVQRISSCQSIKFTCIRTASVHGLEHVFHIAENDLQESTYSVCVSGGEGGTQWQAGF